jgi:hypothetical protein
MASPLPLMANPRFSTSCLIEATPFYQRLIHAGVFEPIAQLHIAQKAQPAALLFRMARSFKYTDDKSRKDVWQKANVTAQTYRGDCEDKAIWLYTQLRKNNYENVALVIGKYGPQSREFHMWVTYTDDAGQHMLLDPTIQRKPWKVSAFPDKLYRPAHVILSGGDCLSY